LPVYCKNHLLYVSFYPLIIVPAAALVWVIVFFCFVVLVEG